MTKNHSVRADSALAIPTHPASVAVAFAPL